MPHLLDFCRRNLGHGSLWLQLGQVPEWGAFLKTFLAPVSISTFFDCSERSSLSARITSEPNGFVSLVVVFAKEL